MSFPSYSLYNDAGVDRLGRIPEHWTLIKLRRCTVEHRQGYYSPDQYVDDGVKLLRITDIHDAGTVDPTDCPRVRYNDQLRPFLLEEGDFVFARTGGAGSFGLILKVSEPMIYASYLIRFRFSHFVDGRFLKFVFLSPEFRAGIDANIHGGVNQNVHAEDIKEQLIALPSPSEQAGIATFLDSETAKIDDLVAEQQRLIELLQEKRQAVISHAVTKGLDPAAPMKDSGVEWLGEVPAHWTIQRLKGLIREGSSISYGIVQPGEPQDEGVPFVQTTNMTSGSFAIEDLQKTTELIASSYPRSELHGGEVILGIRASIGAAHVVPATLRGVNLSRGVARIECGPSLLNAFLANWFRGRAAEQYWQLSKQGSTFNEVSIETVRELALAVPPLSEQQAIVDYLGCQVLRFDNLLLEARRSSELLRERRNALISSAVTGKIDVRHLATAPAEAA